MVREYWTETRNGLVIEGNPTMVQRIATALNLPPSMLIQVSNSRSVLGLWGEAVRNYQELVVNPLSNVFVQQESVAAR